MISAGSILVVATLLGAVALWLLLPRTTSRGRIAGVLLGVISLGLLASQIPRLGNWLADSLLLILSTVTVVAAAATVTLRNPIYSAIWFGLTLVGTAGLFLLQGAEFLAVATVIVYAGAILVTFLFLLMLADPQGRAHYDRISWESAVSAFAGSVIVGVLSITIAAVLRSPTQPLLAAGPTPDQLSAGVLNPAHVHNLGLALFERHLVAVEVAGVLLLAALVGAAAMVAQRYADRPPAPPRPADQAAADASRNRASPDPQEESSQPATTPERHE